MSTFSSTTTTTTTTANTQEPNPFLFSSLMGKSDPNTIRLDSMLSTNDPQWLVNYFSIIMIILLYISLSLKFTWPIRIEETLIIILLWMLISNTFNTQCHCCTTATTTSASATSANAAPAAAAAATTTTNTVTLTSNETITTATTPSSMCQWEWFSIVYSVICIVTAILSFLSDIKNRLIATMVRFSSFALMMFIIFIPVSCNQFRFVDINVLIIKITFYNIIWLMNRYMRFTENVLESEYKKCFDILKDYDITFTKKQKKKSASSNKRENGPELDLITASKEELMTLSPRHLFETIQHIGCKLNQKDLVFKSDPSKLSTLIRFKNKKASNNFNASSQISLIQKIHTIAMCYARDLWGTRLISWKNNPIYNDLVNYLIDISRTIWILAICPVYLFIVIFFILWLLYYIRVNANELKHVLLIRKVMDIIHENKIPMYNA